LSFSGSGKRDADQMTLVNSQHVDVVLLSVTWATLIGAGLALAPNGPPSSGAVDVHATRAAARGRPGGGAVVKAPIGMSVASGEISAQRSSWAFPAHRSRDRPRRLGAAVLRNTLMGLQQDDRAVIDAGSGMGMCVRQVLRQSELLAAAAAAAARSQLAARPLTGPREAAASVPSEDVTW